MPAVAQHVPDRMPAAPALVLRFKGSNASAPCTWDNRDCPSHVSIVIFTKQNSRANAHWLEDSNYPRMGLALDMNMGCLIQFAVSVFWSAATVLQDTQQSWALACPGLLQ